MLVGNYYLIQVDGCSVPSWTADQVGQWLTSIHMKDYATAFVTRNMTGSQLLQLDTSQMKVHSRDSVCLSVCLSVREIKPKRLKLKSPNLARG